MTAIRTNRSNRRRWITNVLSGVSGAALGALQLEALRAEAGESAASEARPPATAKRVIFLFMHGGPSHVDTFDYKPALQANDGGDYPGERPPQIDAKPVLMKSPWKFAQHGECGQWVSELMPHVAKKVDELCVVRSLHSRGQSHGQAVSMLHTGSDNLVRPSVGAWVSYGLGPENQNLPTFVAIAPSSGHGGPRNYGAAFLPAEHQATTIGRQGKVGDGQIAFTSNAWLDRPQQRRQLDLLQSMNRDHLRRADNDARISGAIRSAELAFRMQNAAPEVLDLEQETKATQELYGIGEKETDNFGRQCLLARRMVESGVRYVELSTGSVWDQHSNLVKGHEKNSKAVDKPIAGLLTDLKARGLLQDTLVVWGGEFGRTPIVQGSNGRDHNPQGFTMWMAGGGVKGGTAYGETDDFGYYAVKDRVHMHDFHATMLHLLGIRHTDLTYRYAGRDFRLTDVYGRVVHELIA